MFNNLHGLCQAIQHSRRALEHFRVQRREAVRQYIGQRWSEEGTRDKIPLNLISLYCKIVSAKLIANSPRVMLSTDNSQFKAEVATMEDAVNRDIEKMKLADTIGRIVYDALFSIGIRKVGLATPEDAAMYSWNLQAGQQFVSGVDLDDWVFDIHARHPEQWDYVGHRFRASLEVVKANKNFKAARKDLSATRDRQYNEQGDETTAALGRVPAGADEEYDPKIDMWEIYIPRKRLIVTMADEQMWGDSQGQPLCEQEWVGPDEGPYGLLSFGLVPGSVMPKSPIQDLIDLHIDTNNAYRKLIRQSKDEKEVVPVPGAAAADAQRLMDTPDGHAFACERPDLLKPLKFAGPDPGVFQMAKQLKDLFSWEAGNLDLLGGLGAQSPTATQDKMLNQNSSETISTMQSATVGFVADTVRAWLWYEHHNPHKHISAPFQLPGIPGISIPRVVSPQQRLFIPFEEMRIKVDPYSLQYQTPQQRAQALAQIVQQTVIPMMGLLQQQGIMFDMKAYLQKMARYLDMPDLSEIVTIGEPSDQGGGGGSDQPPMPSQTQRSYVRESRSTRTNQGDERARVSAMMGTSEGGSPNGDGQ